MRPVINVSGIDKCISFGDLITTNVSQAIEKETELGARQVQKREKSLAPVKSGLLRKSIVNRKGKYGISRMVRAKAPHAPLQEYGTKRGVRQSGSPSGRAMNWCRAFRPRSALR